MRAYVALGVMLAGAGHPAGAEATTGALAPTDRIAMDVAGACPDAGAVNRLLAELVSSEESRGSAISIEDRGRTYRITVRKKALTLQDPARDCTARARQA